MGLKPGDSVKFDLKEGYAVISIVPNKNKRDRRSENREPQETS